MPRRSTRRYEPKPPEPKRVLMPVHPRPLEPPGPAPDMWGVQENRKGEAGTAAGGGGGGAKLSLVQIQAQVCTPRSLCSPRTAVPAAPAPPRPLLQSLPRRRVIAHLANPLPPSLQEEGSTKAQQALASLQAEGYDIDVAAEALLACCGDVRASLVALREMGAPRFGGIGPRGNGPKGEGGGSGGGGGGGGGVE